MPVDVRAFVKDHHAFYEVVPYYVLVAERERGMAVNRKVQAGFDVDVYGVGSEEAGLAMPPPREYGLAYAVLRGLAADVARDAADACFLEVIPFPATVVLDARGHGKVKGMLRIRVSHGRGLDQPAGPAEHRALGTLRQRLDALGIAFR